MYIRKLVTPLLITIVLCSLFAVLPAQIFAAHCGCGNCAMAVTGRCTCSIPPYWCLEDPYTSEFKAANDTRLVNATSDVVDSVLNIIPSDVTKRVMSLVSGGECLHKKVTLNLLRNVIDAVELVPAGFEEKI